MKLLCVIDSLGSGGAQRQMVELAKGFKERGCDVSFLVYHEENFFKNELDRICIPIVAIIEPNYIKRLFKMRKFIRKGNYDAVLSFLEAAGFICEFAGLPYKKWKLIVSERSANPDILKSLKRRFYRWFHLFADYIVANSNENLRIIRKINPLLSWKKCHVIYNLIDFDYWKSSEDYILCEDGKIHILVAASHQYMKNAKGLIEAVDSLKDNEKQRIKIDWYGDERSDDSLQNALIMIRKRKLENIFSFKKATSDIRTKMQYADVVGLFSFYEGLPNVVCEAMVVGKPIISSSVSDIPIILDHDINCIFNPKDSKDISKTISYILSLSSNELLNLGKLNKLKGYRLFDKNRSLSSYLSLLRS